MSEAVHEYVGIAVDEPARLERVLKTDNASAPLADFGITEEMAFKMCQEHYLLSPIYKTQKRSGCWFCHNARLDEMRDLWRNYPELGDLSAKAVLGVVAIAGALLAVGRQPVADNLMGNAPVPLNLHPETVFLTLKNALRKRRHNKNENRFPGL